MNAFIKWVAVPRSCCSLGLLTETFRVSGRQDASSPGALSQRDRRAAGRPPSLGKVPRSSCRKRRKRPPNGLVAFLLGKPFSKI